MWRGIERLASPSASSFMSSRRPLRTSLLNSSGVKGRLGSSSIGRFIRGPKNRRTRLASRRMSIPSRQQQTFESAYCSSCTVEIARGRNESARKISRGNNLLRPLRVGRRNRRSGRTRHCLAIRTHGIRGKVVVGIAHRNAGDDDLVFGNFLRLRARCRRASACRRAKSPSRRHP